MLLVAIGMLAAAYYAVTTVNLPAGLHNLPFDDVAFIKQHNPIRLVPPEWVGVGNQDDLVLRWVILEIKARLITVIGLWFLGTSFFIWQYVRKARRRRAA